MVSGALVAIALDQLSAPMRFKTSSDNGQTTGGKSHLTSPDTLRKLHRDEKKRR